MRRSLVWLLAVMLPQIAGAQTPIEAGHQLFTQNCSVCHLKPQLVSPRYGPELSRQTVTGREDAIHGFIALGTARMPGFQYDLKPEQIDLIIGYLATVEPQPKGAAPGAQGVEGGMR